METSWRMSPAREQSRMWTGCTSTGSPFRMVGLADEGVIELNFTDKGFSTLHPCSVSKFRSVPTLNWASPGTYSSGLSAVGIDQANRVSKESTSTSNYPIQNSNTSGNNLTTSLTHRNCRCGTRCLRPNR